MVRTRQHAGAVSIRWPLVASVILILALLGVAAWFVFLREGAPLGDGRETPAFTFDLGKVGSVAIGPKASQEAMQRVAQDLRGTLDAMYTAGFVDPDKWEDGAFPEVLDAFADGARPGAEKDLADLSLGPAWSEVEFVRPQRSRLTVEFLLTEDRREFAAVATTAFRASGDLAGGGTLLVTHRGRYLMRQIDGEWRIVGYEVDGKLRPGKSKAPTP